MGRQCHGGRYVSQGPYAMRWKLKGDMLVDPGESKRTWFNFISSAPLPSKAVWLSTQWLDNLETAHGVDLKLGASRCVNARGVDLQR